MNSGHTSITASEETKSMGDKFWDHVKWASMVIWKGKVRNPSMKSVLRIHMLLLAA
eukprot:CAMPEP_0176417996 /NCGR_PEP_ID=MMETSP0127-20121128/7205_1 /TAXON_ID=938130 /ORGANISM="Platyophrya macrostoma, Strain WH" /LENGTH=55 /DNA_ID=CAMNT_0017798231 /DNA_START=522 /DNA_END=689 /DNA_ORIENTATION=+